MLFVVVIVLVSVSDTAVASKQKPFTGRKQSSTTNAQGDIVTYLGRCLLVLYVRMNVVVTLVSCRCRLVSSDDVVFLNVL